jgi:hypothetical protein
MTSDEFDKAIIDGAVKLMLENEKKFFTLTAVEGRVLAKEFEGMMWIKATDHSQAVKQAVEAEREACAKVAESGRFLHDASPEARFGKECASAIRARGQE